MKTQVLIVGGGFGGLNVAKALAKDSKVKVTLIDRRNHHLFQPLLYQVATAGLSPADIATPIRTLFAGHKNVEVLLDEALEIFPDENRVVCKSETITYDYLILACGAAHSYFGHNEWEEFAPGLKTLEQATEIRRRVLTAFEEAEKESDPAKRDAWLTFSIVGGGPTGVELAGAIAELAKRTVRNEFSNIDASQSKIYLIEAGPRVLAQFEESLSKDATKDLEHLGVQVKTSTRVTELTANDVKIEVGNTTTLIPCKTKIWAAGVAPSAIGKKFKGSKPVELDKAGRVAITQNLNLASYQNVFVIGDQAALINTDGKPLPGLAPVAMQQGRHAAKNVALAIAKKPLMEFHYLDKGNLATIGRKKAVLQFGKIKMSGLLAWIAWLFIHIFYLIGFKNRFFVFWQWTWNYLTYSRGARLIVDKDWHLKP
jgi:NADH dehydrogenase